MPSYAPDILPQVRRWLARRSSTALDWPTDRLLQAKGEQHISIVLPARNEEATVGKIVRTIRTELMERKQLVDEIVVVDSRSRDRTAAVAAEAGARVVRQDDVGAGQLPRLDGKGAAMWAGLAESSGDIVVFVDADLYNFRPAIVTGLLGPLLSDADICFVKGFYHRPLLGEHGSEVDPDGGGRVTELVARPLLNLFWPELAGFVQPLAGEYAARRAVLERVAFVSGYGVETGLLIDLWALVGLNAMAQVDLDVREHRHQRTHELGRMAAQIVLTAWSRLERQRRVSPVPPRAVLAQFLRGDNCEGLARDLVSWEVRVDERPPLRSLTYRGSGEPALSARSSR